MKYIHKHLISLVTLIAFTQMVWSQATIQSVTSVPVDCNGGTNGQIITTITGGVPPYVYYLLKPGYPVNRRDTSNLTTYTFVENYKSSIDAGFYLVLVRDNNGAGAPSAAFPVDVNEPTAIISGLAATYNTCQAVGVTLDGNPSGGNGTYTHLWSGPDVASLDLVNVQQPIFTNAAAGTYNVTYTATDIKNCTGTANTVITVNPLPTAYDVTGGGTRCSSGSGLSVGLSNSQTGVNYQLLLGGSPVGGTVAGTTGLALDFGLQTAAGTYTVTATNSSTSCFNTMTGSAIITINPASVGGTVTGGTTICTGSTSALLTLSGYTGTITRWEYSIDGGVTWTPIANTIATYTSGVLTQTTRFRAVVTSGICPPANSTSTTVTVSPTTVGGNVTGGTTICSGSTSGVLTLSGQTGNVIRWQSSINGGTSWTNIANTLTTYTSGALTQTTDFRAVVRSGACAIVNSTATTVTVIPGSVGGTVTGGTTICTGSTSGLLTLAGYTGTITRWESSTDGGTTWTPIANTLDTYTSGVLTQTTQFRAVVTNGICPPANSTATTVTVSPASVGGTVTGGTTICSGSTSAVLTLAGHTGTVTRWESSTDGGTTWTPIVNTLTTYTSGALTQTTQFRAVITSGACASANSTATTVTVNPASVGGAVTGGTTICTGSTSALLTLAGHTGTVTRWESSTDGGTTWTPIVNTLTTYTSGALTQTTQFRAVVTNGVCPSANSTATTVTVSPTSVGGSVSGGTTICSGSTSGELTLAGHTGTVTRWESSTDGGTTWTPIVNTLTTYTSGALTQTTQFRAVVTSGACASDNSTATTVTVTPGSVGGAVTGGTTICSGSTSAVLTLAGHTGTVTRWESSTDGGTIWTPIANTLTTYTSGALTQTTQFRAVVTSGVCPSANSTATTVTVSPTSVGGSVTGGTTICTGSTSAVLTLAGHTGTVTRWESSTDGGVTWTPIVNTLTTYTSGVLTQTTRFRAVVTSSPCSSANSTSTTVTVSPVSVGGTVTGGTTICSGSTSGVLTLSGHTGTVTRWESSTDGGTTWTPIVNTLTTYTSGALTQTTQFRAVVTSGSCPSANSTATTVTVNPTSVGGTVTGGATVCSGSTSGVLTLAGHTGTVTRWESSTDGGTIWTPIANTLTTYTSGALTQTTQFRAVVTSGVCPSANSASTTVTVTPASVGGAVTGGTTICSGSTSGVLTLAGHTGTVTRWESSTDGGTTWTPIVNTLTTYTSGALTQTTQFRAVVTSGSCPSANSTATTVTVNPTSVGGTVTGGATVCSGSTSGVLTLAGHTGTITRWESSTDGGTTWTPIVNTLTTYTSGALTQTTQFRAVVTSGVCPSANSAATTVTVNTVTFTYESTPITCYNANDGTVTFHATGGTAPYLYSIEGDNLLDYITDSVFLGINPDMKHLIVQDALGCKSAIIDLNFVDGTQIFTSYSSTFINGCYGDPGSITLTATGGSGTLEYSLTTTQHVAGTYQSSGVFNSLMGSTNYYGFVRDVVTGCVVEVNSGNPLSISQPAAIVISVNSVVNVTICSYSNNGIIRLNPASGGTTPPVYTYYLDGISQGTNRTYTNLIAGVYAIRVMDGKGCYKDTTLTLTAPPEIVYDALTTQGLTCHNSMDGEIHIVAHGGTGLLQYSLNGGALGALPDFVGIDGGSILVRVQDANACLHDTTITVSEPDTLQIISETPTAESCIGNDGTITVVATGGNAPLTYSINPAVQPNNITGIFSSLTAGAYTVTVTDASSCPSVTSNPITVTTAGPLVIDSVGTTNPNCSGVGGQIRIYASGSSGTYQYSTDGGTNWGAASVISVVGGTYNVEVRDLNLCATTIYDSNPINIATVSPLNISSVTEDPQGCSGISDITVNVTGGTGTIEYSVDGGTWVTTNVFTNLATGNHTVDVRDAAGCSDNTTVNIVPVAPFTINATSTPINSPVLATITITTTGGVAPFNFNIDNGVVNQSNATGLFINLASTGTYNITVTDATGCVVTGSVLVFNANALVVDVQTTNPLCNGDSNGEIQINIINGLAPYTFTINGSATDGDSTGLAAGVYTVFVRDANDSTYTEDVTLTNPAALTFTTATTPVSNIVTPNGTITIHANGGTAPYQYAFNGGAFSTDSVATGLAVGTHTFIIRDANNCQTNGSATIVNTGPLDAVFYYSARICHTATDGYIEIRVVTGMGPFQYSRNNGVTWFPSADTFYRFENLGPGIYRARVRSAIGEEVGRILSINEAPTDFTITSLTATPVINLTPGTITVDVTGGWAGNYTYYLDGVPNYSTLTTYTFNNVTAGWHYITAEDDAGCTDLDSIEVPAIQILDVDVTTDSVTCNGLSTGAVNIHILGGNQPYRFSIDSFATFTAPLNVVDYTYPGLPAGTYQVMVKDNLDSTFYEEVNVYEPAVLDIDTITTTPYNGIIMGTLTVTATGGTLPYLYSQDNFVSSQASSTFNGLTDGWYYITVRDAKGCEAIDSAEVLIDTVLHVNVTKTDYYCDVVAGQITLDPTNAVYPVDFYVDGLLQTSPNNIFYDLLPGIYDIEVIDAVGKIFRDTVEVLDSTNVIDVTANILHSCDAAIGGSIDLTITGGVAPYDIRWYTLTDVNYANTEDISNLVPDRYYVDVIDTRGCYPMIHSYFILNRTLNVTADIDSATCASGSNNGTITLSVTGTLPYSYSWDHDPTLNSNVASNLAAGSYTVLVTDANCSVQRTYDVVAQTNLLVNYTVTPAECSKYGEVAMDFASGTPDYTVIWTSINDTVVTPGSYVFERVPGSYPVHIADNIGCFIDTTIDVGGTHPVLGLLDETSTIFPRCINTNDGTMVLNVIADSLINFEIYNTNDPIVPIININDTVMSTYSLLDVYAGHYRVFMEDTSHCMFDSTYTINAWDTLSVSFTVADASCADSGRIAFNFAQGNAPYRVIFTDTNDTIRATGNMANAALLPGSYPVILMDSIFECKVNDVVNVGGVAPLLGRHTIVDQPICNNTFDGNIQFDVVTGDEPYTYTWSQGGVDVRVTPNTTDTFDLLSGLQQGIYTITLENGTCTHTENIVLDAIDQFDFTADIEDTAACNIKGSILVTLSNGIEMVSPLYKFTWDTATVQTGLNATSFGIPDVLPGTYTLTIVDSLCSISKEVVMMSLDSIEIDSLIVPKTCKTLASIDLTLNSIFDDVIVKWADLAEADTLHNTNIIPTRQVEPGVYKVEVTTPTGGCHTTKIYTVLGQDTLRVNAGEDAIICRGNRAYLYGSAFPMFTDSIDSIAIDPIFKKEAKYLWTVKNIDSYNNFELGYDTLAITQTKQYPDLMYKPKGYTYILTATFGTCSNSDEVYVEYFPTYGISFLKHDTSVSLGVRTTLEPVLGGESYFKSFAWVSYPASSDMVGPDTLRFLDIVRKTDQPVTYYITATSTEGCMEIDSIHVTTSPDVQPVTGLSPNGDGINDFWYITNADTHPEINVEIFNRWGEKVYSKRGYRNREGEAWDGKYNNKALPVGTYYYVIKVNGYKPRTGPVTICR
jgi:gliding motility-associated-like protein